MNPSTRARRTYDHRLRDLVRSTGDILQATRNGIPRSTARGWLRPDYAKVISFDVVNHDLIALQRQVLSLDRRLQRSLSLLRIFILLFKLEALNTSA
jgi:hypothetical protein